MLCRRCRNCQVQRGMVQHSARSQVLGPFFVFSPLSLCPAGTWTRLSGQRLAVRTKKNIEYEENLPLKQDPVLARKFFQDPGNSVAIVSLTGLEIREFRVDAPLFHCRSLPPPSQSDI